jgi:ABC-type sugar transport system ATPase subunit
MASIMLEGVAVTHAGVAAVSDVTLSIEDRELVVVIGPSDGGKTTLLRAVAGKIGSESEVWKSAEYSDAWSILKSWEPAK